LPPEVDADTERAVRMRDDVHPRLQLAGARASSFVRTARPRKISALGSLSDLERVCGGPSIEMLRLLKTEHGGAYIHRMPGRGHGGVKGCRHQ
jgi:hypothetical protein